MAHTTQASPSLTEVPIFFLGCGAKSTEEAANQQETPASSVVMSSERRKRQAEEAAQGGRETASASASTSGKEKRETGARVKAHNKKVHSVASFASGCVSGVLSAVILQPTDVLKTKMQVRFRTRRPSVILPR